MKLKLKYFFIVVTTVFLLAACTKEKSYENGGTLVSGGTSSGTSTFTLSGTSGSCASAIIEGTYVVDSALNDSNRVIITVTVDSIGTYNISTGTASGISFTGSGIFTAKGLQTVTLIALGKPTAVGLYNFIPGTNGCSFTINITSGASGGGTTTTDCKACAYVPVCVGSKYTYLDSTLLGSQQRTATYLSVTDTTIDGATYQKLTEETGSSYLNCNNGITTVVAYNITSVSGTTTLAEFKQIMLEANVAVGTTWSANITNGYGQVDNYLYKIAEKGISRTVLGVTYNNVIHVNVLISVSGINANYADYYYASGVGLIEADNSDYNSGTILSQSLLKSYSIP